MAGGGGGLAKTGEGFWGSGRGAKMLLGGGLSRGTSRPGVGTCWEYRIGEGGEIRD